MTKERIKFVLDWERRWKEQEGEVNVSELCRLYGISRECGHKWIRRYRESGYDLGAMTERSRRPQRSPTAVEDRMQDVIVEARKLRPRWGPVKLLSWLRRRWPGVAFPSSSAIAAVLKRRGLVRMPRRARRGMPVAGVTAPFPECLAPNAVWCVDFKGWFLTGDGCRCYPLTITDAYSRFVIRCEGILDPNGTAVTTVFDSAFQEYGLPGAIRSDNGPPFASTGAAGLTQLSVWWLRLGILLQRIAPGKPQQNGRHERMHRTLKLETKVRANLRAQQREFDHWRQVFNNERPHEALENQPPATVYGPSPRHYPRQLKNPEPAAYGHLCRVDGGGFIRFRRRKVFISTALSHLDVELVTVAYDEWEVRWGAILLGEYRPARRPGLVLKRRKRGEVSAMSVD